MKAKLTGEVKERVQKISDALEASMSVLTGAMVELAFLDEECPCGQEGQIEFGKDNDTVKPKKTGNYKDWDEFYSDFYRRNPGLAMSLWISLELGIGLDNLSFCTAADYGLWDDGVVRLAILINGNQVVFKLSKSLSVALSEYMNLHNQYAASSEYIFRNKNGEMLKRNATHNAINYLFHIKNFACSKPTYHVRNLYAIKYGITY